jgi:NAD(P)-dependent dehydrogenase (short-subunit alcohol dehydrogenase family)
VSELTTELADKVALVTGAGQGVGRAIAHAFGKEGATVALVGRNTDKLEAVKQEITASGGAALVAPADVGNPEAVAAMRDHVRAELGEVDILINNSGIAGPTAMLWEQSLEDWEETLRVNLTGVFLCCRAFLPAMVARESGSVIVIGSMTGKRALIGRTPYAASKTALIGLVRTLAWEAGEANIRVNLISPGPIAGPRLDSVLEAQATARGISSDQAREEMSSGSPLKRFVDPNDVASAAIFLTSPAAEAITGEDLNVSAGIVSYG